MALKTMKKGDKLHLAKAGENPVFKLKLLLSWITPTKEEKKSLYEYDFDSILVATKGEGIGKGFSEETVCYYEQPETVYSKFLTPDNQKGNSYDAQGNKIPDEIISLDLTKVPAGVEHIPVIVNLHKAASRGQNFTHAKEVKATLVNEDTGEVLAEGLLTEVPDTTTSVLFVMLNREANGDFIYEQVNMPYANRTLHDWFDEFGFESED